jgi:hypothetical protein
MRARIFVNSPLQVIGAWEFMGWLAECRGGGPVEFDVVLVNAGTDGSRRQTKDTADRLGIATRDIGRGGGGVAAARERFALLRREVAELESDDLVAVGDPCFDLYLDALARTPTRHAWVLDDGVGNWRALNAVVACRRLPGPLDGGRTRSTVKRLLVGGLRTPRRDALDWFSMFARYLPPHERIHQNGLDRLKSLSPATAASDDILFLGSPLVASGILSGEDYTALCREAARILEGRYPRARLVYLRHRREGAGEAGGMACFPVAQASTGPVELHWIDGSASPRAVAGVLSTALFTLAELLRGRSDVVSLWPGEGFDFMARRGQLGQLLPLFDVCHAEGSIDLVKIQRPGA